MKMLIYILFLLKLGTAFGQAEAKIAKKQNTVKTNTAFLLGFWEADSGTVKIEFKSVNNGLALTHPDINYYTFYFLNTDSLPLNGVSMTWPPNDCRIRKLNENHIEIQYTAFMQKPSFVTFKRVNPPGVQSTPW